MIVGAHGTFENPDIPSFYILLKEENMLYKHVNNDMRAHFKKGHILNPV